MTMKLRTQEGQEHLPISRFTASVPLFNDVYCWDAMKVSTLPNCWKKLLQNKEIEVNSEGIEAEDIYRLLQCGGETGPGVDDV